MSCYLIEYENGAKVLRPILTREKYLQLRGLAVHKDRVEQVRQAPPTPEGGEQAAAIKKKLLQFNYSCIPPEDGKLRGCKTPSTTVGMDIDRPTPLPNPPLEGEGMDTQENWYEEVKQKILSKKDELGLLMMERSATKGYHIVFRRHEDMTQEENLRWASDLLGVEFDKAAKDITRVFFATTDSSEDLIYLDDALFVQEAAPLVEDNKQKDISTPLTSRRVREAPQQNMRIDSPDCTRFSTPLPLAQADGEREASLCDAEKGALIAFDLCVKSAGLSPDSMDVWGKHTWHSNLMAVLSVGLPKLMTKEQLLAVVNEKLPNYSQTDDCRKLIDYFYEKYSADRGYMTSSLREINAQAQLQARAEDDAALEVMTKNWNPPQLPKKIPRIMQLLAGNFDPRFREMLMLSALPVLSAHASHFRAKYLSGRLTPPQQYVAVIAGSGKGKGNCTRLFEQMCEHTLTEHDKMEWMKVAENSKLRDRKANAKDRPEKYHPQLRIFMTTSKSSMQELQNNCGENGMLMGMFSEVDELFNSNQISYANLTVTLRKGWDGDLQMQYYLSDSTVCAQTRTNIALLMCGTPNAMLKRMLGDTESGFLQRCIPVIVPNQKRTFRPPKVDYLSHDDVVERDALLLMLYQKDLALGDDICELQLPKTCAAIGRWFDELEELYNDGKLTDAEADLSHRCGEFMLRAAIPLVALEGEETKQIVDFAVWVGRTAHYYLCQIFGARVSKDLAEANALLSPQIQDSRRTAEPLLSQVPEVFTLKQFQEIRANAGQSENCAMLLKRYCDKGKIERVQRGVYKKVTSSAESK